MDIRRFNYLRCFDNLIEFTNPKVGDCFLTGKSVINQKDLKEIGDEISWYEVLSVGENKQISYAPRYGRLEKPKMEEKKKFGMHSHPICRKTWHIFWDMMIVEKEKEKENNYSIERKI